MILRLSLLGLRWGLGNVGELGQLCFCGCIFLCCAWLTLVKPTTRAVVINLADLCRRLWQQCRHNVSNNRSRG